MRSHGNVRRVAEWLLRALLFTALGVALWRSMRHVESVPYTRGVLPETLERELRHAMTRSDGLSLELSVDSSPSRSDRDALVALRRSGVPVRWTGMIPPMALEVVRTREPSADSRLLLVGGERQPVTLSDSAGTLETVRAESGATVETGTLVGAVRAAHGRFIAVSPVPPDDQRRAVLVLGRAGWESKFVMAALAEAGWVVRARIPTAPGVTVSDDALLPLDTARYDVVVALDSSAADFTAAIVRFVAQGGGLVAGGSATTLDAFRPLLPARSDTRRPGRILLADDSVTPSDLPMRSLASLRADAVSLARERSGVTLAARRAGLGRALAVGYDESWRWRMLGGQSGLGAHRRWWSRTVGSVAPEHGRVQGAGADAAPRAAIVDALGPPSSRDLTGVHAPADATLPRMALLLVVAALLAETASRRFRGVR